MAVLDTGIDTTHRTWPAAVAADFAESGSTTDRLGHGTHVASIVAGSGARSGGERKGVAFEASLLNGKVLDDFGFGSESGIIAGMEWAAAQRARVVNMSLGGWPTDGSDPMSQAVDRLTARYRTLFVISAGNRARRADGREPRRVPPPSPSEPSTPTTSWPASRPRAPLRRLRHEARHHRPRGGHRGRPGGRDRPGRAGRPVVHAPPAPPWPPRMAGAAAVMAQRWPTGPRPDQGGAHGHRRPHPDLGVYEQGAAAWTSPTPSPSG